MSFLFHLVMEELGLPSRMFETGFEPTGKNGFHILQGSSAVGSKSVTTKSMSESFRETFLMQQHP